jgi:hypothetical protein
VEAGAAAFNHGAWAQVAAFGLSDYHTPVPDCPLGATNSRSSSDFGNEVPVFLRDFPSGAIKGKVANALPSRGCTTTRPSSLQGPSVHSCPSVRPLGVAGPHPPSSQGSPLEVGPPSPLEIVKDFGYQGKVWRTIEQLIENGSPTAMLSIQ